MVLRTTFTPEQITDIRSFHRRDAKARSDRHEFPHGGGNPSANTEGYSLTATYLAFTYRRPGSAFL